MRVALIHDFLLQYGGAERVLQVFKEMYPDSVIYTLCFNPDAFPDSWMQMNIIPLMPILPGIDRYPQFYAPYLVAKMRSISLADFDLVISSDTIFSKMVNSPPGVMHICYQYSPADMLYHFLPSSRSRNWLHLLFTGLQKSFLRREDYFASQLPERFITLSHFVGHRINKYYRRDYSVIYPPVSLNDFVTPTGAGEYYLLVGRLVPNKLIDLAVNCCTKYDLPLVVLGNGEEINYLRSLAGKSVRFITDATDPVRNQVYALCKALLVCNEEDFGITPVEAMSYGRGVIAYRRGGVEETVVANETGLFFEEQTIESLYTAIKRFNVITIDAITCRKQAEKFSRTVFISKIRAVIDELRLQRVV